MSTSAILAIAPALAAQAGVAASEQAALDWSIADEKAAAESETVQETLARSRVIVADSKRGVQHRSQQLPGDGHLYDKRAFGVPRGAKLVIIGDETYRSARDPADTILLGGETVFRHYTAEEAFHRIVASRILIPGSVPFSYGGQSFYEDLIGVFLTSPTFRPDQVGVPLHHYYLDLRLRPGTGLVRLGQSDNDQYFMIPGNPNYPVWFIEKYLKWIEAGRPSPTMISAEVRAWTKAREAQDPHGWWRHCHPWSALVGDWESFAAIDAQGGLLEPSRIPIMIVDTGQR